MSSEQSQINVTPLIDILLVLLITFMVITPLAPRGLAADVPSVATELARPTEQSIVLQLSDDHALRLNGQELSPRDLSAALDLVYSARANKVLFIEASNSLEYRDVAQLIDRIRGINPSIQVGLVP